jgi:formiminotetrahydrofolate cyclodeaminase
MTVSMAAGLVAMTARCSGGTNTDSRSLAAAADDLIERATALADADVEAYSAVLAVQRERNAEQGSRDQRLRQAMHLAAEVPLAVTAAAAQTARLGAQLSKEAKPALAGDVATAVHLAAAAARAAAGLVAINVRAGKCDEDLIRQATRNVDAAQEALAASGR